MMINTQITDHLSTLARTVQKRNATGRGSRKKIDLYGIKKLRELILELAVRGKLVPQNPEDEPASVLLERIAEERDRLVKEKKIKKPKKLPEIGEGEKPFELPMGWAWTKLGSISEIGPRNSDVTDETTVSFVPMPLVSTSYNGSHGSEERLWQEIKKGYTHFANGDIAIAKITPCFENSKAAVFSGLISGVGAGTTELHVARPFSDTINPLYILLYLKSPHFLKTGELKMTGSAGQKRVPKDFFAGNPLPFPPLVEQHRIVTKVDELMTLCDQIEQETEGSLSAHKVLVENLLTTLTNTANAEALEHNWHRIAEHFTTLFTTEESIDQLKQTILQLAVMGKLVPQDPNDEPAAKLLERIAAEKAQLIKEKKIKKQKALPPITEEEKPFVLPEGWEWCRLAELVMIRGGKRVANGYKLLREPTPYIYIRVADMKDGSIDDSDLHYIDEQMREKISQYIITTSDIYMTIVGATIGKCGLVPNNFDQMNLTENAARLTPSQEISKSFLHKCLESNFCQNQFIDKTKQVGVQKMALNRLASTLIPLPPKEEAPLIEKKVIRLNQLCDQIKTHLQKQQQTRIHLTDAMVESALA